MNLENIRRVPTRVDLIRELPEGSTGVEIGVLNGDFSQEILDTGKVSSLHLVDPWKHWYDEEYLHDPANAGDSVQIERLNRVIERFATEDRVMVSRGTSVNVFQDFSEAGIRFTFAFIDGRHDSYYPLMDLMLWSELCDVLFIHDFCDTPAARAMRFTVWDSVRIFTQETRWRVTAVTDEEWATARLDRML